MSPVVRIAANEGWMVKRTQRHFREHSHQLTSSFEIGALDAGAHGIVVPLLNSAEDAQKLVKSAKFPPRGNRGFGSPFSPEKFGLKTLTEYLQQANDALVTIIQIETQEALHNIDSIAQTPGVDVLFIGPFDLGNNIGHPIINDIMADELKEAIATIKQSAQKHEKKIGMYCTGTQARQFADEGFNMVGLDAHQCNPYS